MNKSLLRSAISFFLVTLAICLLLGLSHMFGRSVTLDNVRAIDFRLIHRSIETKNLKLEKERQDAIRIMNALVGPSGYALFPMAILTNDSCMENGGYPRLCRLFENSHDFSGQLSQGQTDIHYGTQVVKTITGEYFFFQPMGSMIWLVGNAGHYVGSDRPFHQEFTFLSEAPRYFTTMWGFNTMWRKSIWTWVLCVLMGLVSWILYSIWTTRADRHLKQLMNSSQNLDKLMGEKQAELQKLRAERDAIEEKSETVALAMEEEVQSLKVQQMDEIKTLQAEQQIANELLDEAAKSYGILIEQQKTLQDELAKARKRISSTDRKSDADSAHRQLYELKKLWLTDPDWLERHRIESEIAARDLGRSPFTDFIAFVRMEHYIKKTCAYKGIHEIEDMLDGINALYKKSLISEKDKKLLHSARMARNSWFHEGKPPEREIVERLLNYLNTRKHPEIRPLV